MVTKNFKIFKFCRFFKGYRLFCNKKNAFILLQTKAFYYKLYIINNYFLRKLRFAELKLRFLGLELPFPPPLSALTRKVLPL